MWQETPHEFVQAMIDFLIEAGLRANRPAIVNAMMRSSWYKYEHDIKIMSDLADESEPFPRWRSANNSSLSRVVVADRKKNPIDKQDLLSIMLNEKDSKTGLGLSDENIRCNVCHFIYYMRFT